MAEEPKETTAAEEKAAPTEIEEIEIPVGDTKIKTTREKLGEVVGATAGYERILNNLVDKGIINEKGELLVSQAKAEKAMEKEVAKEVKEGAEESEPLSDLQKKYEALEAKMKKDEIDRTFEKTQATMEKTAASIPDCQNEHFKGVCDTLVYAKHLMDPTKNVRDLYKETASGLAKFKEAVIKDYTEKKVSSSEKAGAGPGGTVSVMKPDGGFKKGDLERGKVGVALRDGLKALSQI